MVKIRFIGDMHGNISLYNKYTSKCNYSIQVGDLGFDYSKLATKNDLRHIVITGNHDNYDDVVNYSNFNPKPLSHHIPVNFVGIRGAFSVDVIGRIKHFAMGGKKTWWDNEEMSYEEMEETTELVLSKKPDLIVSHDCPSSLCKQLETMSLKRFGWEQDSIDSRTQQYLENLFKLYQPSLWVFGHWHQHFNTIINGTRFICVKHEEYIDLKV